MLCPLASWAWAPDLALPPEQSLLSTAMAGVASRGLEASLCHLGAPCVPCAEEEPRFREVRQLLTTQQTWG